MSDFLAVLLFAWVPFAGAFTFALTAAPLGALLVLRDEILLGLALPPMGAAAIVFAVLLGVDQSSPFLLYLAAVAAILLTSLLIPRKGGRVFASSRQRAGLLVGIFCAGEAATLIMGAASPKVEAHVHDMLRGEVLAMGQGQLWSFVFLTGITMMLGFRFRGLLYALALDEEGLNIKLAGRGQMAIIVFRCISSLLIAAGVIWVGPLLTLGLLAVPALLWESEARGLTSFFRGVILIGIGGVVSGFLLSIALDMPPVPVVVVTLFLVGGSVMVFRRIRQ